jgi:hypothetical protein
MFVLVILNIHEIWLKLKSRIIRKFSTPTTFKKQIQCIFFNDKNRLYPFKFETSLDNP